MAQFKFGASAPMRDLERRAGELARLAVPLLIEGETGAGKETLARYLHSRFAAGQPLMRSVAAAEQTVPPLHSCLAMGGWVLLKGVNRLDRSGQDQVLAALDESLALDPPPRMICTSPEPLNLPVSQQRFGAALYHRVAGVTITIPP